MIPGEYTEILSVHAKDTSPFLKEIEKDVTRTFPGNVFFGGYSAFPTCLMALLEDGA
jgi:hypothetical protein